MNKTISAEKLIDAIAKLQISKHKELEEEAKKASRDVDMEVTYSGFGYLDALNELLDELFTPKEKEEAIASWYERMKAEK